MPSILLERTAARPNARQEQSGRVRHAPRFRGSTRLARGLAGVVVLAVVWQFAPKAGVVDPHFVPPLSDVLATWWSLARDGVLWHHLGPSLMRAGVGFGVAVILAVPLGAAIAWYSPVRDTLVPVLEIFRNTAALAVLPVFIMVLGIGEMSKIAIVTYACLFPILLNTISGVAGVDAQLLRTARVLGLSPVATFRRVVAPAALPTIFTGVRISGAAAVLVLIAAEMIGANSGLGFLITYSQNNFLINQMYAGIITTTALGLVVNYGLIALERRMSRWRSTE